VRSLPWISLAVVLAACAPQPTPIVVTLTAPPPTPTVQPVSLAPPMDVGAKFLYVDGTTLVAVPHGSFVMGHGTAENPEHTVTLSDYWIYSTEVTNHQYSVCVNQGRCSVPDASDNPNYLDFTAQNDPVVGVTYAQARAYCNYLTADLPSEAQWEKAARGTGSNPYPWGDAAPSCNLLNFNNCLKHTTNVTADTKGKSPYGALDMEGNVYEWVADWYDPLYYRTGPSGDPPGPVSGGARVIRSSSYRSNANQSLAYARSYSSPSDHRHDLGFRCAVKDLNYFAPSCQSASTITPAGMSSVVVDCPNISIDVQVTACRYGGGAVVTFRDDHAQDPNASFGGILDCSLLSGSPGSFPLSYQCKRGSTAVMSSACTYSGITEAQCPDHYVLNPVDGICQWSGSRTPGLDCPTGEFFDPVHHCCLVSSGKLPDFPVCPAGTVFAETAPNHYSCLPADDARSVASQAQNINPPVCPGACNLSPEACTARNLVLCENTCSCLSVGLKCPTH
jgi:formylglycine-generating enzyme required for sulfatase activity